MTLTSEHEGNGAPDQADATCLTPHERLRELTAILANGIHRLRGMTPVLPECREIPGESSPTDLEVVARSRPDGTRRQPERAPEA